MKERFKSEFKKVYSKSSIIVSLVIIILGVAGYFGYIYFYDADECGDESCYQNALLNCEKIWFTRQTDKYLWRYEILEEADKFTCKVEVRLLKINEGDINAENLEGKSMVCDIKKTENVWPEKDMLICSGSLREESQEIIINRMHNYLLENIGKISEEFESV